MPDSCGQEGNRRQTGSDCQETHADTSLVHAVDAAPGSLSKGARVRPRWRDERTGLITDIECFEVV